MSNETQSDRVFGAVRADILGCRLLPGGKLRINEIAERNDVSLGAVREALSRLGAEGLVVAESQKGFRVAPLSADDFRDLTDARIEIEKLTLARSIARGGLSERASLSPRGIGFRGRPNSSLTIAASIRTNGPPRTGNFIARWSPPAAARSF